MAVSRSYDFEIDSVSNPIPGKAAWFFVVILLFIFHPIDIEIHQKILDTEKISQGNFMKPLRQFLILPERV